MLIHYFIIEERRTGLSKKRTNDTLIEIAQAIFTINRHAKTALKPKQLYTLKKAAIDKLLQQNRAKKIGLHFSNNPKYSNQYSTLLVKVHQYYFHVPPSKQDFEELEHLGALDDSYRNPRTQMSLSYARKILYDFLNWKQDNRKKAMNKRRSSYYIPSSLGQMEWPPTRNFNNK